MASLFFASDRIRVSFEFLFEAIEGCSNYIKKWATLCTNGDGVSQNSKNRYGSAKRFRLCSSAREIDWSRFSSLAS